MRAFRSSAVSARMQSPSVGGGPAGQPRGDTADQRDQGRYSPSDTKAATFSSAKSKPASEPR